MILSIPQERNLHVASTSFLLPIGGAGLFKMSAMLLDYDEETV